VIARGGVFRRHAGRLFVAALILVLYALVPSPELPYTERETLADDFDFARSPLPELLGHSPLAPCGRCTRA